MLFSTTITQLQGTIANITTEIDELQRRIEKLRDQKLALENHLQQLGSAESAAESALEQIKTALHMIHVISPSEVTTFKAAIDQLFEQPFQAPSELPSGVDPDSVTEPPQPSPNGSPETIEVEASVIVTEEEAFTNFDDGEGEPELVQNLAHETNGHNGSTEASPNVNNGHTPQLQDLSTNQLKQLLTNRGLDTRGRKQTLIDRLLEDSITLSEIQAFLAH